MLKLHPAISIETVLIASIAVALFLPLGREVGPIGVVIATWFLVCLAADRLCHKAPDKRSTVSMVPAAHIATLAALPAAWGTSIVALTSIAGAILWRRRRLGPAVLRGVGSVGISLCALSVLVVTNAYQPVTECRDCSNLLLAPGRLIGLALAGVVYLIGAQAMRSLTAAHGRGVSWWSAWRSAYGYETGLVTSAALVIVAILGLFCFVTLGYRGILLCIMPLMFVRDGSRRYIELEAAQEKLIQNERLAAKGEMAAEIGHELNNFLAAISGRAQLMMRNLGDGSPEILKDADGIRDLSSRMAELSKGLMDFSHRGVKRTAYGVNELVEKTVEFVRPQTRFQGIRFEMEQGVDLPSVQMDPGQIQQVLLTLFGKVADRLRDASPSGRNLSITTVDDKRKKTVGVVIRVPSGFEADREQPDPELNTLHRILERHQGRLETRVGEDGAEAYHLLLPAA